MEIVNNIKDEIEDLSKTINTFEKSFSGIVDEVESLDDNLNVIFKEVKDFSGTIDKKFLNAIKIFFNQVIKKVLDPKFFTTVILKFFGIIWTILKKFFNLVYNKYPEVRYIIFGVLIFMSLPLLALLSSKILILQLFLPVSIILAIMITLIVLIYLNIWNIWTFIFNFIIKTIIKIDYADIVKDIVEEIGDLIESLIKKIIN